MNLTQQIQEISCCCECLHRLVDAAFTIHKQRAHCAGETSIPHCASAMSSVLDAIMSEVRSLENCQLACLTTWKMRVVVPGKPDPPPEPSPETSK